MDRIDEMRLAKKLIVESHLAQMGCKKCKICNIWMAGEFIAEDGTCEECNPKTIKAKDVVIDF